MMVDYATNKCSPKNGTFGTLEILLNQDVDVVFGPVCSTGTILISHRNRLIMTFFCLKLA